MKKKNKKDAKSLFEKFASRITLLTGKPATFIMAFLVIIAWAVSGPLFSFSDTWQLVINTGTTIVTFLMVFVIQHSQNKDTTAIQLKLNELIASSESASNRLVDIEDLSSEELETLKKFYIRLAQLAKSETELHTTHSIDDAQSSHLKKHKKVKRT